MIAKLLAGRWSTERGRTRTLPRVPVRVEEATAVSEQLIGGMGRLFVDGSSSAHAPTQDELHAVLESPTTRLLVALDRDDNIVGSLTLALVRIPTGLRAGMHDLQIDEAVRQQGVEEMLIMEALRLAHDAGVQAVDLSSAPGDENTDPWYRRLGFKERITVYRRELS